MDLYLDTADTAALADLMPTGLFFGITTNPLLAHRAGLHYSRIDWGETARRAADLAAKELHGQVFGAVKGHADWAGALYVAGQAAGSANSGAPNMSHHS